MQIVVEVPNSYLDAMHRRPDDFALEAKLAMASFEALAQFALLELAG